jgi:predicted ribosomally synthesized peptide with nif11-like leader
VIEPTCREKAEPAGGKGQDSIKSKKETRTMSAAQVQAFLKMAEDADFLAAFQAASTPEAKREVLTGAGLDIALEEAEAALQGERELDDLELDKVAGGDAGVIRYPPPLPPPP